MGEKKETYLAMALYVDLCVGLFEKAMKVTFPEAEVFIWHRNIFLNFLFKMVKESMLDF